MHVLCKHGLSACRDRQCTRQRRARVRQQLQQARGKARLLRKEIQHRFPPGAMGALNASISGRPGPHVFTVVGWSQTLDGWEALVLVHDRLSTWGWSTFEACRPLEEFARN